MGISKNEITVGANGGTEQLIREFEKYVPAEVAEEFQIIPSRNRGFTPGKIPIYWAHDLPGDPECVHLGKGGYQQYKKLVFVSNWQMQAFINYYKIPWSYCTVMQNAIEPLEFAASTSDKIKLIYHTTPHRGLEILVPVFIKLCERYDNIELDVYSSFNIYGWGDRDKQYQQIFDAMESHPNINNHGSVSSEKVRQAVTAADIFAYPSIWQETSCRSLMEAMSAGLLCVHSDYGALYETAAGLTMMYHYDEDKNKHAGIFYNALSFAIDSAIAIRGNPETRQFLLSTSSIANTFYNWQTRSTQWTAFLQNILNREKKNLANP